MNSNLNILRSQSARTLNINWKCFSIMIILWTEKKWCKHFIFLQKWCRKCGNEQNEPWKFYLQFIWKRCYRFFFLIWPASCGTRVIYTLKISLLSVWLDFEIIDLFFKWAALRYRRYGNSCWLQTDEKINFGHTSKDVVVSRKSKLAFYKKFWFQKVHH